MNKLHGWRKYVFLVGLSFSVAGLAWAMYESLVLHLPEHTSGHLLTCEFVGQLGFSLVMISVYPFHKYNQSEFLSPLNHTLYAIAWFLAFIFVVPTLFSFRLEILPFIVLFVARLVTHSNNNQDSKTSKSDAPATGEPS